MKYIAALGLLACLTFVSCKKSNYSCSCTIIDNTATPPDTSTATYMFNDQSESDAANACSVRENELGTGSYYDATCSLQEL